MSAKNKGFASKRRTHRRLRGEQRHHGTIGIAHRRDPRLSFTQDVRMGRVSAKCRIRAVLHDTTEWVDTAMSIKKWYLILAFCSVSAIGLLYGVDPAWFARTFFAVPELHRDFAHILRALTGLYLALGAFWLYAAFHSGYRNAAIVTTAIFAGGLVAGRLLSLTLDGLPSPILVFYIILELGFVPIALWVLRRAD